MSANTCELFIEIRCEELPARFVARAIRGLEQSVRSLLKGIEHGPLTTWATPRRIAVSVADVAEGRPVEEKLVTGPPARAAFRDGKPTKAAMGFARGRGVDVSALEVVDGPRGEVVAARVRTGGEATVQLVAAGLEAAVLGIDFPKTMRWSNGKWARPIHGVVALYNGDLIPCSVAGIAASNTTLGHRLTPGPLTISGAADYVTGLHKHHVIADRAARRAAIEAQLSEASGGLNATVGSIELVDEVVDLVEWPSVVTAAFEAELLELPPRLLVESMGVHQRVFPLFIDGALTNRFLVISNHPYAAVDPECAATIGKGNTKVLAARFHDAKFFYAEDRKQSLAEHGTSLTGMQWIRKAGTMSEKAARVSTVARALSGLTGADAEVAARAGALSKADLATQMVGEFPELQGHVGRLLAHLDGEDSGVPVAIEEHYLPRFSGDALPTSPAGVATALADRLDTLVHCFRLGLKPKGSADPLGLRRAAGGLVVLVMGASLRTSLPALLDQGGADELSKSDRAELVSFVLARARAQLTQRYATDLVDAVLATGDLDLVSLDARCAAMSQLAGEPEYDALKQTFKRVANITKELSPDAVDYAAEVLVEDSERALHDAFSAVRDGARARAAAADFSGALSDLRGLKPAVDRFFDEVMVMVDDDALRAARQGLLNAIAGAFRQIADFKHLS